MKKILVACCILYTFISCDIQYDGETKLVVTGKLIDNKGVPIPETNVDILINGLGTYSNSDIISYGKTDINGNFTYIFPAPGSENEINISINNFILNYNTKNATNEFQSKQIIALLKNFKNYKLNLNTITLYRNEDITQLQIILNPKTDKKQLLDVTLDGNIITDFSNLNPLATPNYTPPIETNYSILKNQTLILKYKVVDYSSGTSITTENNISIPVSNEKVIFTLTY
ncbi:hypothetical protein [Flavobacterium praedii]|uniref:hypothetical protein n=1 Tax=Flavobacterium praedii TaxID=3002900 RepID=UPI002481F886|nr:hypothetical protein [Flavobacterium praedii]